MIYNLEAATFTVLGNFITSCYTKNWLWQGLLRKPLYFKGNQQQGRFLLFTLPVWLPYNDCILLTGEAGVESKLKDLFLPMQIQKQNENQHILVLNLENASVALKGVQHAELVYWPCYRFVIEPMTYSKKNSPSLYMLKAFDYVLRVSGHRVQLDEAHQLLETSGLRVQVRGTETLDCIEICDQDGLCLWSLSEKIIRLEGSRFEMFQTALGKMISAGTHLENCSVRVLGRTVELRYVG